MDRSSNADRRQSLRALHAPRPCAPRFSLVSHGECVVQAVVADDAAETEFLFARLVSRHLIISSGTSSGSSRRYEYTVQGVDGRSLVVDKRTASSHPLKASGDADFWDCACCSSRGWSVEHAMICLECGAPTPVSEARLAQQRQAKRADLARERPRNLKGRRIVKEVAPHTGGGRAKGVYSM